MDIENMQLVLLAAVSLALLVLSIPCTTGWPGHVFRIDCAGVIIWSLLALRRGARRKLAIWVALVCASAATWVISSLWSSAVLTWCNLMLTTHVFMFVSAYTLLGPQSARANFALMSAGSLWGYYWCQVQPLTPSAGEVGELRGNLEVSDALGRRAVYTSQTVVVGTCIFFLLQRALPGHRAQSLRGLLGRCRALAAAAGVLPAAWAVAAAQPVARAVAAEVAVYRLRPGR